MLTVGLGYREFNIGEVVKIEDSLDCAFCIIAQPTPDETSLTPVEVKVAVSNNTLSPQDTVKYGQSLQENNYEGITVYCGNTNQLNFVAMAGTSYQTQAVVKVFAVVTGG